MGPTVLLTDNLSLFHSERLSANIRALLNHPLRQAADICASLFVAISLHDANVRLEPDPGTRNATASSPDQSETRNGVSARPNFFRVVHIEIC